MQKLCTKCQTVEATIKLVNEEQVCEDCYKKIRAIFDASSRVRVRERLTKNI